MLNIITPKLKIFIKTF